MFLSTTVWCYRSSHEVYALRHHTLSQIWTPQESNWFPYSGYSLSISYVVLNFISILCIYQSNIKVNSLFGVRKTRLDLPARTYIYQSKHVVPICHWIHHAPLILGTGLIQQTSKYTLWWSAEPVPAATGCWQGVSEYTGSRTLMS